MICYEQLFCVSNFIFCSLLAINDSQYPLRSASLPYLSCVWGTYRVHMLEMAKPQRSYTNTSLSINCDKTSHDHHITKIWAGLVTQDSKISGLRCVCKVYFFLSFPVALIVCTSSSHFAQPEVSSSSAAWTWHVHPKASAFLCSQDLSDRQ